MNPLDIDGLEKLLGEATKGPWHVIAQDCECADVFIRRDFGKREARFYVARLFTVGDDRPLPDAELICALRNQAPALIAEVKRLRRIEAEARVLKDFNHLIRDCPCTTQNVACLWHSAFQSLCNAVSGEAAE